MPTLLRLAIRCSSGMLNDCRRAAAGGKVEPLPVFLLEALDLGLFLGEGFHHACPAQVLLDAGGQRPQLLLDLEGERAEAAPKADGLQRQEGHESHREQPQAWVHADHHDGGEQHQHHAFDDAEGGAPGEEADALDILDGAREQVAGFGLVVEGEGEQGDLALQLVAQVVGHALRGDLGPAALEIGEERRG